MNHLKLRLVAMEMKGGDRNIIVTGLVAMEMKDGDRNTI